MAGVKSDWEWEWGWDEERNVDEDLRGMAGRVVEGT
jgi:hypothetical protein